MLRPGRRERAWLENASVSDGQFRIIRGQLRVSQGILRMEGESLLTGSGTFDWIGPGSIAGNWEVLEGGVIKVGGVLISPVGGGRIMIGQGPVAIILDGATGKILVGNLTVDPGKSGGAVTFANGAEVFTDADTIQVFKGNSVVQVSDEYARLQNGGDVVEINGDGIRMSPGAVPPLASTGLPAPGVLLLGPGGYLRQSDGT